MQGVIVRGRELLAHWSDFDWIVSAAKSESYLIEGKASRRHLIIDLSVPRNVDPQIQGGVCLWNIEQIDQMIEQNRRMCSERLAQSEMMVQESVSRYVHLYRAKIDRFSASSQYSANL